MFGRQNFVDCINDQLAAKGFGEKRAKEVIQRFNGLLDGFASEGYGHPQDAVMAMNRVFAELADEVKERAKRTIATLNTQAMHHGRVQQGLDKKQVATSFLTGDGKKGSTRGVALAQAAVSLIRYDPRFKGQDYVTVNEEVTKRLISFMDDAIKTTYKGAFGVQRGKAHLPNVPREAFGENTGDATAKALYEGYTKAHNIGVDLFNMAGGSLKKLDEFHLPQRQIAAKLIGNWEKWRDDHLGWLNWSKMRRPDGSPIKPSERVDILKEVFDTLGTNGANKLDAASARGEGTALGNQLSQHRFLIYKDAASWQAAHDAYGEGSVFEIMISHLQDLGHRIALLRTFGPNPGMAVQNIKARVLSEAAKLPNKELAVSEAEGVLARRFEPMMKVILRTNPMDPNSTFGAAVDTASNLVTAAVLGSAAVPAVLSDFVNTAVVRSFEGLGGPFGGTSFYLQNMLGTPGQREFLRQIATQSGFVSDQVILSNYAAARFTGFATRGPWLSRVIADGTIRASLLANHTASARIGVQLETMGMLARSMDTPFDQLPFARVLERNGITAADWDAFRQNVKPYEPAPGVKFLRPIDLVNSGAGLSKQVFVGLPNAQDLFSKFQGFILRESYMMVPGATIEGAVALKDTTRPDTLGGAILQSFAMYKNYPISIPMIYGRLGLSNPSKASRLGFYAAMAGGMAGVGAMTIQLRELINGRDPLPMNTPQFLGKAVLTGGGLSIWGDFLFSGINEYGRGPAQQVSGPLAGLAGDVAQLAFGDLFQAAEKMGGLGGRRGDVPIKFPAKAVEFARRYTPGTSIWWARAAFSREIFDVLAEMADPNFHRAEQRKARKRREDFGNESWWAPGTRSPQRAPSFQGLIR